MLILWPQVRPMGRTPFYDILWPSIGENSWEYDFQFEWWIFQGFQTEPRWYSTTEAPRRHWDSVLCPGFCCSAAFAPWPCDRCGWELGAGGKETHVARLSLTVLVGRLHSTNIYKYYYYSDYDKSAWFTLLKSLSFKVPKRSERRIPLKLVAIMFRRLTPHRPSLNWQALSISGSTCVVLGPSLNFVGQSTQVDKSYT